MGENGDETLFFIYNQPSEPNSELIMLPAYEYDFEFDMKEIYTTLWMRKKIDFVNHLAGEWDDGIKKIAEE